MMIQHLQTTKKVKHLMLEESQNLLAMYKLEYMLKLRQHKNKLAHFNRLIDNLTFPISETSNVKTYL
jgi:hypothetical protein